MAVWYFLQFCYAYAWERFQVDMNFDDIGFWSPETWKWFVENILKKCRVKRINVFYLRSKRYWFERKNSTRTLSTSIVFMIWYSKYLAGELSWAPFEICEYNSMAIIRIAKIIWRDYHVQSRHSPTNKSLKYHILLLRRRK